MKSLKIIGILSCLALILMYGWNNLGISEERRELSSFNSIYAEGPVNVYISQAEEESVTVRSDSKLLKGIITDVKDNQLRIFPESSVRGERILDVYVSYKNIDTIIAARQSTITSRNVIKSNHLTVEANGSAELKLQVNNERLNLIMNERANVQLAGKSERFDFLITAFGDLMAYNLVSNDCKAIIRTGDQSPGIARINVVKTLDVTIIGPRHLKYKGGAEILRKDIAGKGKVISY